MSKKKMTKTSLRRYFEVKYPHPAPQGEHKWSRWFPKDPAAGAATVRSKTSAKGLQIQTSPGAGADILKEGLQSTVFQSNQCREPTCSVKIFRSTGSLLHP